jgi:hypothetical protein
LNTFLQSLIRVALGRVLVERVSRRLEEIGAWVADDIFPPVFEKVDIGFLRDILRVGFTPRAAAKVTEQSPTVIFRQLRYECARIECHVVALPLTLKSFINVCERCPVLMTSHAIRETDTYRAAIF